MPSLFGEQPAPAPTPAPEAVVPPTVDEAPFEVDAVEEPATPEPAPEQTNEPNLLPETVVEEANQFGIDVSKAKNLMGNLPQITAERDVLSKQYDEVLKMDIEDPKTAKAAKELRIKIRDNRTKGIMIWHKTTKDYFLRGGQFVDAIKAKEVAVNERMEESLETIEKHMELKRKREEQELREKRAEELTPYKEFVPIGVDLGTLSEPEYMKIFNGAKLQFDFDKQQKEKAEQERLEQQRKQEEKDARIKKLLPFKLYIPEFDSIDFDTITEEQMQKHMDDARALYEQKKAEYEENKRKADEAARLKAIRDARAAELQPYIVFIRDYNALIEKEEADYQKEFADIKKGAEEHWQHEMEQNKKKQQEEQQREEERKRQEQEQEELRKKNEQLQKELEQKKKNDAEAEKQRKAEERRLKNAPDKSILIEISDRIRIFPLSFPEVKSEEAKAVLAGVQAYFKKIADDVKSEAESLIN